MQHCFDSDLLLHHDGGGHRAHARLRTWAIRNIYAVDPRVLQKTNRIECLRRAATLWRQDLDRSYEFTPGDFPGPVRSFFRRHYGHVGRLQFMHADLYGLSDRNLLSARVKLPDCVGDHLDMRGRRAAASANELSTCLNDASRIF